MENDSWLFQYSLYLFFWKTFKFTKACMDITSQTEIYCRDKLKMRTLWIDALDNFLNYPIYSNFYFYFIPINILISLIE